MPTSFSHTPKYRRQSFKKKRGQAKRADIAFVELNGERRYLGVYGSPESREAYDRIIAEYLAHGRELKKPEALAGCTVATIAAAFLKWAENEYKKPDGTLSARFDDMKYAIKPLITLYASLPAEEFGPMKLEAVRKAIIVERLARKTINERISIIKRMFGWAVTQELISAEAAMKLKFLKGLARGKSDAKETEPVKPVEWEAINAIKPHVSKQVWALIRLQLITGARPGELVGLRACDLTDTSCDIWLLKLSEHKTAHHGKDRIVPFNADAQAIVKEFMAGRPLNAPLFSPQEAEAERRRKVHEARKTPLEQGNSPGTNVKENPTRPPGTAYTVITYRRAITRGCDAAFPPPAAIAQRDDETKAEWLARLTDEQRAELVKWERDHHWHPHQLRHNAATFARKESGIEASQVFLGHSDPNTTLIYAERDLEQVKATARKMGGIVRLLAS